LVASTVYPGHRSPELTDLGSTLIPLLVLLLVLLVLLVLVVVVVLLLLLIIIVIIITITTTSGLALPARNRLKMKLLSAGLFRSSSDALSLPGSGDIRNWRYDRFLFAIRAPDSLITLPAPSRAHHTSPTHWHTDKTGVHTD
jgi:hypothetical protein